MSPAYRQTLLFTPPRMSEEKKIYWPGMQHYGQQAVATGGFSGPGFRGDVDNFFNTLHTNFMDLVGTFTGQKGQTQARQDALVLAQLKAQQSEYEAQQRAQAWGSAAPWLAVGAAVAVVAVVMSTKR